MAITIPAALIPVAINLGAKLVNLIYEFLQAKTGMSMQEIHDKIAEELQAIQDDLKKAEDAEAGVISGD